MFFLLRFAGYLTGSDRLPDDREYKRPGLLISGALTLAVDEVSCECIIGRDIEYNIMELLLRNVILDILKNLAVCQ